MRPNFLPIQPYLNMHSPFATEKIDNQLPSNSTMIITKA